MEIAYAAGFFDGEGWLGIVRLECKGRVHGRDYTRYQLKVSLGQADPRVPHLLREQFGGVNTVDRYGKRSSQQWRPRHTWFAWSKLAYDFLVAIRPYLIEKADQADIAIQFFEDMKGKDRMQWRMGDDRREAIYAKRDAWIAELAALKRRDFYENPPSKVALRN